MLPCTHTNTATEIVQLKVVRLFFLFWFLGFFVLVFGGVVFVFVFKSDLKGKQLQSPQSRDQSAGVPAPPPCPAESSIYYITDRLISPSFTQLVIFLNTDLPQQEVRGTSVSFPLLIAL